MSPQVDYNEMVWAEYNGYILKVTDKAIGLGKRLSPRGVEMWLPTSKLGLITYVDGGDKPDLLIGEKIEAVHIPRWLARKKQLIKN